MLTAIVALVLAVTPGAILGFCLPHGRARWAGWAAAPILTLGLISLSMAWLPVVNLPSSATWVLGAEFVFAGAAAAVAQMCARRGDSATDRPRPASDPESAARSPDVRVATSATPRPRRRWRSRARLADVIAVTVSSVICVSFGRALVGRFPYPPGWDGMNHALLTRNIMESGSTAVTSVCTTGSTHTHVACHFYPLAADVAWAQAAVLSGGHLSIAMTAWAELIGPLALVAAIYATVRALGGSPIVAACVAAVPAVISPVWQSMLSGRVTEEVTPGLSVAVALLIALAIRGNYPVRLALLGGLGTAGLLMTHTYDALFAGCLTIAFVPFLRGSFSVRAALPAIGATVLATVAVVAPLGTSILGAKGERVAAAPLNAGRLGESVMYWITDFNRYALFGYHQPGGSTEQQHVHTAHIALWLTIVCLLASPLCFAFKELRWARPWFVMWVLWTVIGIWTSYSGSRPAHYVASLWYNVPQRVLVMIFPVYAALAVAGACAIGLSVATIAAELTAQPIARSRLRAAAASVAALALVVPLLGLGAAPSSRSLLRTALAQRVPQGTQYARVFVWLKKHTPPGRVVAYDHNLEFMTWSYANYGVPVLFAINPVGSDARSIQDYNQRVEAWDWLVDNPTGTPAGACSARRYGVEFVVTGSVRIPGWPATYSRALLAHSPNVDLVHRDTGIKVYRVTTAGRTCGAAAK